MRGQDEGTGLFSQPADEELIRGEIFWLRQKKKKKEVVEICLRKMKKIPLLHFLKNL